MQLSGSVVGKAFVIRNSAGLTSVRNATENTLNCIFDVQPQKTILRILFLK